MMNLEDVGQFGKWTFNIPPGPLHMELQFQTNNRVDVVWVGDAVPDIIICTMISCVRLRGNPKTREFTEINSLGP